MKCVVCFSLGLVPFALLLGYYFPSIDKTIRVGAGFSAKQACSSVFVSNRSLESVVDHELSIGGTSWLFRLDLDRRRREVRSRFVLLPLWQAVARHVSRTTGCTLVDGRSGWMDTHKEGDAEDHEKTGDDWPALKPGQLSSEVDSAQLQAFVDAQFTREAFERNQTRAVVVVYKGHVVAEGYQSEFLDMDRWTRHLGWSMSKTLLSLLIGMQIDRGMMSLDDVVQLDDPLGEHTSTVRDLLRMADVLSVPEDYSTDGPVPEMLYIAHSSADYHGTYSGFRRKPLGPKSFYYSSTISNILSKVLRQSFPDFETYWSFPEKELFGAVGATSFVLERDGAGNFVLSSFSYANARDWARIGQLIVQRGMWGNKRVISEAYLDFLAQPFDGSAGAYGSQVWLNPNGWKGERAPVSYLARHDIGMQETIIAEACPPDTVQLAGHNGQYVFAIPSMDVVIVRLGLTFGSNMPVALTDTPELWEPPWDNQHFLKSILLCFHQKKNLIFQKG